VVAGGDELRGREPAPVSASRERAAPEPLREQRPVAPRVSSQPERQPVRVGVGRSAPAGASLRRTWVSRPSAARPAESGGSSGGRSMTPLGAAFASAMLVLALFLRLRGRRRALAAAAV